MQELITEIDEIHRELLKNDAQLSAEPEFFTAHLGQGCLLTFSMIATSTVQTAEVIPPTFTVVGRNRLAEFDLTGLVRSATTVLGLIPCGCFQAELKRDERNIALNVVPVENWYEPLRQRVLPLMAGFEEGYAVVEEGNKRARRK